MHHHVLTDATFDRNSRQWRRNFRRTVASAGRVAVRMAWGSIALARRRISHFRAPGHLRTEYGRYPDVGVVGTDVFQNIVRRDYVIEDPSDHGQPFDDADPLQAELVPDGRDVGPEII